jgi:hypothetical protein
MQASHLCHHHLCIVHVVYESAEVNTDRKQCYQRAKFLRHEGLPVPPHCERHQPCCELQHAVLTTFETLLIQFFVLLLALGLPLLAQPPRPRWHTYPTFEFQLPLKFCEGVKCAVAVDSMSLVNETPVRKEGKPDLICRFCTHIKSFQSLIAMWSHFVHEHVETGGGDAYAKIIVEEAHLLQEICRTACLWREYWEKHSDGCKKRDPTMLKINQTLASDFTWETVLDWKLQ